MKKLFSYLIIILFNLILAFISYNRVWAVDLTITCANEGPCNMAPIPGSELFLENNQMPGDNVTRSITVVNNDSDDDCSLILNTKNETDPDNLATVLYTVIKDGASDIYGVRNGATQAASDKDLSDVFAAGDISLGTVAKGGGSRVFDWTVTFNPLAGNEYQNKQTVFDFDLAFSCGSAPAGTTGTTAGASTGDGGGGGGGPGGPPTCSATAPTNAPSLSASATGANTVLLTWSSVSPVTHYAIVYGTSPGAPKYGAANVGNTTTFTVSGLSGGVSYYFKVAGVNDCAPGPWSNEASTAPSGGFIPEGPAPGFEVLGAATPSAELKEEITLPPTPEVKGETACVWWRYLWWLPLVIQFLLSLVYYYWLKDKKISGWWLPPILLALLSQLVHEILGCLCSTSKWCPWYWLFNLIILAGLTSYYWWRKKDQSPNLQ